jgi:hypothetical protein
MFLFFHYYLFSFSIDIMLLYVDFNCYLTNYSFDLYDYFVDFNHPPVKETNMHIDWLL